MKKNCGKCEEYDNGVCDKYGIFTEPGDHCMEAIEKEPTKLHWFDHLLFFILFAMFGLMIFYYCKTIEPLPDTIEVISRTEKVIRTYYGNPEVQGDVLVIQDAALLGEVDVSNRVE